MAAVEDRIFVPMRPMCDYLTVDWVAQRKHITNASVISKELRSVAVKATEAGGQLEVESDLRRKRISADGEEQAVNFYDDELWLLIVQQGDRQQAVVPVRPICEFLDVDRSPRLRRINRDPILFEVTTSVTVTVTETDQRGQVQGV